MITVRFFATLRDMAGVEVKDYPVGEPLTLKELKKRIGDDFPALREIMDSRSILVSVNQEFAKDDSVVRDGDEVAFMPPFSGG